MASGRRSLVHKLALSDRSGGLGVFEASLSNDERSYAYAHQRAVGLVCVVEGAK